MKKEDIEIVVIKQEWAQGDWERLEGEESSYSPYNILERRWVGGGYLYRSTLYSYDDIIMSVSITFAKE